MEGIELQHSAPQRDGQDIIGQGDLEDSSPDQELPLVQGHSNDMESGPNWLEPSEQEFQDFVQEMRERSTLLDTSDAISGFSSNSQEDKHRLGIVGEGML